MFRGSHGTNMFCPRVEFPSQVVIHFLLSLSFSLSFSLSLSEHVPLLYLCVRASVSACLIIEISGINRWHFKREKNTIYSNGEYVSS